MYNWSNILKNILSLSGAQLFSKGISFVTTIYLARVILPEGFGILGFSAAFVSYFLPFIDFGFDKKFFEKIASDQTRFREYANNIISIRIILSILAYSILSFFVYFLTDPFIVKFAILLTGFNFFVTAITTEFAFQSINKFSYLSSKILINNLIILILVFLLVSNFDDILIVIGITTVTNFIMNLWLLYKYNSIITKFSWSFNKKVIKELLSQSYPLLISLFMISVYYNLDMIFLGNIKTQFEVGIYNAAYKIFLAAIIPLGTIVKVFLPGLSEILVKYNSREIIIKYAITMLGCGVILSILVFFGAETVTNIIFGKKFLGALFPLKLLALNIAVVSVNMFFGNPLTVWNRQKEYSIAISFGAITNLILNILLIPEYSYNGAAFATLISEAVVFIGVIYFFNSSIKHISS